MNLERAKRLLEIVYTAIAISDQGKAFKISEYCKDTAVMPLLAQNAAKTGGFSIIDTAGARPGPAGELPTASTRGPAKLTDLAAHPLVNSLVAMAIEKRDRLNEILGKSIVIYDDRNNVWWFGGKYGNNSSFLDIFDMLSKLEALDNG